VTDSIPEFQSNSVRRVRAVVALRLLEVIRDQDLPVEVLEEEDPTRTMPRRLGLSDVVERQIRTYKEDVRKRVRLSDSEIMDLFRLVIRRPDGEDVFYRVGEILAADEPARLNARVVPRRVRYALARARVRRGLKRLFGRRIGGFGRGPFSIEGRSLLFIESDPGGDACHFLSGFCRTLLQRTFGEEATVAHTLCQARGDELCRWEGAFGDDEPV
jgi:hypothetical protein